MCGLAYVSIKCVHRHEYLWSHLAVFTNDLRPHALLGLEGAPTAWEESQMAWLAVT